MIRLANDHPVARDGVLREQPPGVLVVDDELEVLEVVAEALVERGYRVLGALDGQDAIEVKSREISGFGPLTSIDVVITDLRMPHASGLDLLQHLSDDAWSASVIVMSAFADHLLWEEARKLGATAMLHKPFFLCELLDLVDRLAPVARETHSGRSR